MYAKARGNNIVTHIERAAAQAVGPFKIPIGRKPLREKLRIASEYDMHTICMRYAYDMRGKGGEEAAVATWVGFKHLLSYAMTCVSN